MADVLTPDEAADVVSKLLRENGYSLVELRFSSCADIGFGRHEYSPPQLVALGKLGAKKANPA